VPVSFAPAHGGSYRVTVGNQSCSTPCTLSLEPGQLRLEAASGSVRWQSFVNVPDAPTEVRLSHGSPSGWVVGPVLVALGVASAGLGTWLLAGVGSDQHNAVGGVLVAAGAIGLAMGVVDLALAARRRVEVRR
jgi:hypothetical protein